MHLSLYDPVIRHAAIEKLVTKATGRGQERKYWRFRVDRWYGGIITADAVGCNLQCRFCWVSDPVMNEPAKVGKFYSPEAVSNMLSEMASKRGLRQLRVSGGEPTIGKDHMLRLLDCLDGQNLRFILETNGIMIGKDGDYADGLSKFAFTHVRVSLKGCNEKEFTVLTGAKPEGFLLQLKALENLVKKGVQCHPAVMVSFSPETALQELVERIRAIHPSLADELEVEELILYPSVQRKIREYGLKSYRSYMPNRVPKKLV